MSDATFPYYCTFSVAKFYFLRSDDQHVIDWPWQMRWLQQAMFESLPLAIIIALAVLFKPTERSRLLAYTSQLPTEDPDDEDSSAEILRGHNRHGLNFHSALYDDAGDEVEMVERKTPSQVPMKSSTSGNRSTYGKLPSADVDDEYGLSGSD